MKSKQSLFTVPIPFRSTELKKQYSIGSSFGNATFDLRDGRMRQLEIKKSSCFSVDLQLWNSRPQIYGSVEIPKKNVNSGNNSVIYSLGHQKQILHISSGYSGNKEIQGSVVNFMFYDEEGYAKKQPRKEFQVRTFSQSRVMLVNDLCKALKDSMIVALNDE